jgi:hypothetical protein
MSSAVPTTELTDSTAEHTYCLWALRFSLQNWQTPLQNTHTANELCGSHYRTDRLHCRTYILLMSSVVLTTELTDSTAEHTYC